MRVGAALLLAVAVGAGLTGATASRTVARQAETGASVGLTAEADHGLAGCYRCGLASADFDDDGLPDLVVAGAFDRAVTPDGDRTYDNAVRLYRNVSRRGESIQFDLREELSDVSGGGGALVVVGDFDGDGRPDFAVQFREGESPNSDTSGFFNKGDWRFTRRVLVPGFDTNSTSLGMAAADIDQDGRDDLIFNSDGYGAGPGLWYRWDAADEAWQAQQTDFVHAISYGGALAAGDLDGDGYPDLVVGGNASVPFGAYDCSATLLYGQIHLNRGAGGPPGIDPRASSSLGRFALRSDRDNPPVCTGMDNVGLLVADVDADGTNDVLIAGSADAFNGPPGLNGSQYDFVVLRNVDGMGDDFVTFEHAGIQYEDGETDGGAGSVDFPNIAVGDVTGDGLPEVFLQGHHRDRGDDEPGDYAFDTRFFLNVGGTDFRELDLGLPDVGEGGQAIADFDGDGAIDLVYTGASLPYHSNATNDVDRNDASTLFVHVYRNTGDQGGGTSRSGPDEAIVPAIATDPDAVALPPALDRPAAGGSYRDPVFGTTVRRVADRAEAGGFEVQLYSQLQAFSPDNAYVLLVDETGAYRVRRVVDLADVSRPAFTGLAVPRWHPSEPHALVHFDDNGDDDLTIQVTDVETGSTTDLATLPDLTRYDHNPSFDEVSRDGRWLAGLGYRTDGTAVIFAWDLSRGSYGAFLPVPELYAGPCAPDPTYGEVPPDWLAPSPLGNYLVVQWARGGTAPCSGLETFDLRTGAFAGRVSDGIAHGDLGVATDGGEFFLAYEVGHPSGNLAIAARQLPGEATVAEPRYVQVLPDWVDGHISCQGPPGVCLVTLGADPADGWQPFEGELYLLALDGAVRRLVHHRSSSCGYWATPRATLSRDGRLVAFSSDWGDTRCGPANDGLGTADTYLVDVPDSSTNGFGVAASGAQQAVPNGLRR